MTIRELVKAHEEDVNERAGAERGIPAPSSSICPDKAGLGILLLAKQSSL